MLSLYTFQWDQSSLRSCEIFDTQEVKFFGSGAANSQPQSREKYRLPENLGFLHAAHFYHLIDFNWSQLNQPISTDNFRVETWA